MKSIRIMLLLCASVLLLLPLILGGPVLAQTVTRGIVLEPDSGKIGEKVTVNGTGFNKSTETADKYAAIYFSSQKATTADDIGIAVNTYRIVKEGVWLDEDGGFRTTFIVPSVLDGGKVEAEVIGGTYYVYICHYQTPTYISPRIRALAPFTVTKGELTLSPKKGAVGTVVEISGADFPKRAELTFKYDGKTVSIDSGNKRTTSTGTFVSAIRIPDSVAGAHNITAIADSTAVNSSFTVKPELVIIPSSGQANTKATVKGTGFGGGAKVTIWFHSVGLATATTNERGNFSQSFTVPELEAGQYTVDAEGENNVAKTRFTLIAPTSSPAMPPASVSPSATPTISLGASSGHIGQTVAVTGNAFKADGLIAVKYDGTVIATTTADSSGLFKVSFSVPPGGNGEHIIIAEDGASAQQVKFTVESGPPPVPKLVFPEMAGTAKAPITFYWSSVIDDSLPVTYDLQVATDSKFSSNSLIIERTGLTRNEYTVTRSEYEKLTRAKSPYYWRVRAIDGALNEGQWASHGTFSITTALPNWALYTIMAAGGVFFFIFGYLVRAKSSR